VAAVISTVTWAATGGGVFGGGAGGGFIAGGGVEVVETSVSGPAARLQARRPARRNAQRERIPSG